jgi:hypothetical protein
MRALPSLWIVVLLVACNQEPSTGPGEIRWDQQVCERCSMSIGDDRFAAQVRGGADNKLYRFDDIGCAVIWLEQQPWKDDAKTEIWVSDYQSKEWIDARQAGFIQLMHSPMGYGLGAVTHDEKDAISFNEAVKHIYTVENREHLHGDQHQHNDEPSG